MKNETFMKEKPVLPLIISMALPMVISMCVNSLYNIVDSYFVAKISENAMTALSLVYPVQNFINAVAIGFGVGINAVIAFHLGAGDKDKADDAATQGLLLSLIHGVVLTVSCIFIMKPFLSAFTKDENVISLGVQYCNIVFLFTIINSLNLFFEKLFQAVGNMKITMVGLMVGCITNIILDPIMIFGIGFMPKMGIKGAALATGLGQCVTFIIYVVYYILNPSSVKVERQYVRLTSYMVKKLYSIGIPAILNLALPSLLISSLNAILAAFSQVYVLVLGVYYKLQTFLYLTANGIVQGMRPIIAYNYGAGEHKRVRQIYSYVLSGIIEAVQCMLFYQIIDSHIETLMFDVRNTVYQFVEYRQQHDSREIGNHQTDGDGKGLVEEDRSCYSAHEHKWNEDGNCRKSGTQHRSNYFGRPFIASLFQRVSSCPVLGNVFRYDDRTVDHHTQSQDQPGDGDDIQRHLAEVEKKETDDQAHHHT